MTAARKMKALHDIFGQQDAPEKGASVLSRRDALRTLMGGAAAGAVLASLPFSNDAEAGQPVLDGVQGMREMRHYSEDENTRGIGVFINMQANAPVTGEQIGQWLQAQFAGIDPPVPVQYRVNQSQGTATDITFYVRGVDFTINVGNLQTELREVLAHHRGAWSPETVSLNTQPQ